MVDLNEVTRSIIKGDISEAMELTKAALGGVSTEDILDKATFLA
jgi:hypothetical protein